MGLAARKLSHTEQRAELKNFMKLANQVLLGKADKVQLAMTCLIANGHLLIEDVPGVGKTTLVRFLAKSLGLETQRIQFTNDLLPADIVGISLYDESDKQFKFHKGPIFAQIVIGDELNRATPKTQSACLQAMEERKVTVDGRTYNLPVPFFFVATQNPREQSGTYPLPESQLDRFLMRIELGTPDRDSEKLLLKGEALAHQIDDIQPLLTPKDVIEFQDQASKVHASDAIIHYIQDILQMSRNQNSIQWGLSPRAGLGLLNASKAFAFVEGRDMVLPDDVQAVGPSVIGHRLNKQDGIGMKSGWHLAKEIFDSIKVD